MLVLLAFALLLVIGCAGAELVRRSCERRLMTPVRLPAGEAATPVAPAMVPENV